MVCNMRNLWNLFGHHAALLLFGLLWTLAVLSIRLPPRFVPPRTVERQEILEGLSQALFRRGLELNPQTLTSLFDTARLSPETSDSLWLRQVELRLQTLMASEVRLGKRLYPAASSPILEPTNHSGTWCLCLGDVSAAVLHPHCASWPRLDTNMSNLIVDVRLLHHADLGSFVELLSYLLPPDLVLVPKQVGPWGTFHPQVTHQAYVRWQNVPLEVRVDANTSGAGQLLALLLTIHRSKVQVQGEWPPSFDFSVAAYESFWVNWTRWDVNVPIRVSDFLYGGRLLDPIVTDPAPPTDSCSRACEADSHLHPY